MSNIYFPSPIKKVNPPFKNNDIKKSNLWKYKFFKDNIYFRYIL